MAEDSSITPYQEGTARIMITNNGPHPPDFWAQVTAEHIAPIGKDLRGARHNAAMMLQAKIADALIPHHTTVQNNERTALQEDHNNLLRSLDCNEHVEAAVKTIQEAAKDTEWEDHFHDPDVVELIKLELHSHFATVRHIERSYHVDVYHNTQAAKDWRNAHHPGSNE